MSLTNWQVQVRYTIADTSKIPVNIIVNGFSIRDTIMEVLLRNVHPLVADLEHLATEIEQAFAVKLKLIQGMIPG